MGRPTSVLSGPGRDLGNRGSHASVSEMSHPPLACFHLYWTPADASSISIFHPIARALP